MAQHTVGKKRRGAVQQRVIDEDATHPDSPGNKRKDAPNDGPQDPIATRQRDDTRAHSPPSDSARSSSGILVYPCWTASASMMTPPSPPPTMTASRIPASIPNWCSMALNRQAREPRRHGGESAAARVDCLARLPEFSHRNRPAAETCGRQAHRHRASGESAVDAAMPTVHVHSDAPCGVISAWISDCSRRDDRLGRMHANKTHASRVFFPSTSTGSTFSGHAARPP
jgi:hypothetical protein